MAFQQLVRFAVGELAMPTMVAMLWAIEMLASDMAIVVFVDNMEDLPHDLTGVNIPYAGNA